MKNTITSGKFFFPASVIAAAVKVTSKTAHRRAKREQWAKRQRGNHFEYAVPARLHGSCAAVAPAPAIFDQARTLRELMRAAAVLGFCLRVHRNPTHGIERALRDTASDFRHLHKFSPTALRRWIRATERGGLTALREQKAGRVGRKSNRLEAAL